MGVRQNGIESIQMASPPDSGVAIAKQEAESRNPSGLRREVKKSVTAKPSVKPRSAGPPQRYQPVQTCKVSTPSVSKSVKQATAAAPCTNLVCQEKRKLGPSQHSSERPSPGKPGQSKIGKPLQNSKESAPEVKKTHIHTTSAPCFASQPRQSINRQPVQNNKESSTQVKKTRMHTIAAPCFASQPGQTRNRQPVQSSKESAPQVKKTRLHTISAPCFASQPGQSQRFQSVQNSKESSPRVKKTRLHTTAASSLASQPGESQRCKSVQNKRVPSQPVYKSHTRTTAAAPSFASQSGESQRCKSVQNRRVSSQPVHKSHSRTTAAPQKLSLEKPLPPKCPSRRRSDSKHEAHNHHIVLCGISGVIDEPRETIGQNCWICEDDLANPPADEESEPSVLPEVAVLACSHVFHSMCLQLVTPAEQFRDLPCFICMDILP